MLVVGWFFFFFTFFPFQWANAVYYDVITSFDQVRQDGCFNSSQGGNSTPSVAFVDLYMVAWWGFPCTCQYVESTIHWNSA